MFAKTVWGALLPIKSRRAEPNWLDAKAYYDEAHKHLKLYETLYAKGHAIDIACRAAAQGGRR